MSRQGQHRFGRWLLIQVLNNDHDVTLQIPSNDKIVEYEEAIAKWLHNLKDVWCTIDGLNRLQTATDDRRE